ncbi:MAG: outer membrane lipoprotein-sorting protein [Proteobacteria bacterium]|nr:outer membrane lipoprotein-sorting protein [Pseudomonadota bacterium]
MFRTITRVALATLAVLPLAVAGDAMAAPDADPVALLAEMQRALVPSVAQFSRVHVTARSDQPGGGSKDWDALVIRQRDEQGPRTAFSLTKPANLKGVGMLTAPHPRKPGLGLWLVTSEERRAVEYSPLEADRQFLSTRFNFDDVALTNRETQPPILLGSEQDSTHGEMWKIETRPLLDRYYSRMLTWLDADTYLPVKREYYDRAGKLWKVVSWETKKIDGIPTVTSIELHDLQSRDTASWRVQAVAYHHDALAKRVLSPIGMGEVQAHPFWSQLDELAHAQASHAP